MIALCSVYSSDENVLNSNIRFLYKILSERTPEESISHKSMPTMTNHIKFVKDKPYSQWYIIYENKYPKGSIYVSKDNEIGLFILKEFREKRVGTEALNVILDENPKTIFKANINPVNYKSINFFKKFGFLLESSLIQNTYIRNII